MLLDVIDVLPQKPFSLVLTFENGEKRRFDLEQIAELPPYRKLKDSSLFEKVCIVHGSVSWPGEIDISPAMLYDLSVNMQ